MERKCLALCFFLVFLLASQEMVGKSEAQKLCKALSDKFKGPCFSSGKCENVCKKQEHLAGGNCKDFQCYCIRFC